MKKYIFFLNMIFNFDIINDKKVRDLDNFDDSSKF